MQVPESYPVYFERKRYLPVFLLIVVLGSGVFTYYSFKNYTVYHIYSAFVFAISLVYLLWLSFNPYCMIQKEYFEINSGLFSQKKYTYRDIQKIETDNDKNKMILIFNDHEIIEIPLGQIRDKDSFIELIKMHVYKDVLGRE